MTEDQLCVALRKIEELEDTGSYLTVENDKQKEQILELEAQCAALRQALDLTDYFFDSEANADILATNAGANLLKRLEAAEKVCDLSGLFCNISNKGDDWVEITLDAFSYETFRQKLEAWYACQRGKV